MSTWKRYRNPLSWLIWIALELPSMLVFMVLFKLGRAIQWCAGLLVRHVYYVFVRAARWVDRRPGWRPDDMMIGVPPPDALESAAPDNLSLPPDVAEWFAQSRARGEALLAGERAPKTWADYQGLSPTDRADIVQAIASLDGPVVTEAPPEPGKV